MNFPSVRLSASRWPDSSSSSFASFLVRPATRRSCSPVARFSRPPPGRYHETRPSLDLTSRRGVLSRFLMKYSRSTKRNRCLLVNRPFPQTLLFPSSLLDRERRERQRSTIPDTFLARTLFPRDGKQFVTSSSV